MCFPKHFKKFLEREREKMRRYIKKLINITLVSSNLKFDYITMEKVQNLKNHPFNFFVTLKVFWYYYFYSVVPFFFCYEKYSIFFSRHIHSLFSFYI